MNALVNYSDDDSDSDQEHSRKKQLPTTCTAPTDEGEGDNDDDILAKLKELQNFAAMVGSDDDDDADSAIPPPPLPPATEDNGSMEEDSSPQEHHAVEDMHDTKMDQDEEDCLFTSFMDEINAVPTTTLVQTQPPPPPPTPPRSSTDEVLPPPPPLPSDALEVPSAAWIATNLPGIETPQAVYSRLHSLSLLPGAAVDQKDTERRLIEFAIRILDWEQGGLKPDYFLGEDYARQLAELAQEASTSSLSDTTSPSLPPFGGIVGAVLKHIHDLEALAAPDGWQAIWDPDEEAYGFQHWRTVINVGHFPILRVGMLGANSLPTEVPTSPPATLGGATSTTSPTTTDSPSPSLTLTATSATAPTPLPPPPTQSSGAVIKKKAKRKAGESVAVEDDPLASAHIHPSRRAVIANTTGAVGSSSTTSSAAPSRMPKKMASLLQKWNVKNMNDSESESEDEGPSTSSSSSSSVAASSGANSEQLGSDWRERRLHRKL
ncbi:hypothetical protein DFQ27_003676 [Actinomortierella ambigua]|uniref:Uncharacterized protein n=1 Tax=Actinomortierella ambigua TaxID=1343610 RepID=A0A9P6Q7H5_9FUNG|nr:hypothetical protein DFQ27_003676 [Actinomortierella ambigua]